MPPILLAVRILVLVVVLITVPLAEPRLGAGARGTAVAVALGVSAVSWVAWLAAGRRERPDGGGPGRAGGGRRRPGGAVPAEPAIAVGCMATSAAGVRLNTGGSLAITAGTVAAFLATGLATGAPAETLLGYPLTYVGFWALGRRAAPTCSAPNRPNRRSRRPGGHTTPRPRPLRWPNGPGWPGRYTTCSPTRSRRCR